MDDDVFCAFTRFKRASDQVFACLDQDLDGDIVRDHVLFDDFTNKVKIRLRC